jgi:hypothetical protein
VYQSENFCPPQKKLMNFSPPPAFLGTDGSPVRVSHSAQHSHLRPIIVTGDGDGKIGTGHCLWPRQSKSPRRLLIHIIFNESTPASADEILRKFLSPRKHHRAGMVMSPRASGSIGGPKSFPLRPSNIPGRGLPMPSRHNIARH